MYHAKDDTSRVLILANLADTYCFYQIDSAAVYAQKALNLSIKARYQYGQFLSYFTIYSGYNTIGEYSKALEIVFKALAIAEKLPNRRLECMARSHMALGHLFRLTGDFASSIPEFFEAIELRETAGLPFYENIGIAASLPSAYLGLKKPDSALWAVESFKKTGMKYFGIKDSDSVLWMVRKHLSSYDERAWPLTFAVFGRVYESSGNIEAARKYYSEGFKAYEFTQKKDNQYFMIRLFLDYSRFLLKQGNSDSSMFYAMLAYNISHEKNFQHYELEAAKSIVKLYQSQKKPDSLVKYMGLMIAANDSVFSQTSIRKFQSIENAEAMRKQEVEAAREKYNTQVRYYSVLTALAIFLFIAFILYRNNRQKQKAYKQLDKQKQATDIQKAKAEAALVDLRSTQAQLIQSEKMASLGELTAGIAHEIQNPLNFVNNFSEVNTELFDEMEKEFNEGKPSLAFDIARDIRQNLEKISQHGKRADAIVKGMLMHSRISTGQKEMVDLNVIIEEYLRISYHGMRAKDKSFNCEIKANLDQRVGKVNLVPQDMGRVLMNLYNNAFYSLNEKKKSMDGEFNSLVEIRTRKNDDHVEINIRDNGMGIPREVIDKIFHPFFTTKPTGQGTGLGLSLCYDIITKEHGGSIEVQSVEGEYAEFILRLPMS